MSNMFVFSENKRTMELEARVAKIIISKYSIWNLCAFKKNLKTSEENYYLERDRKLHEC